MKFKRYAFALISGLFITYGYGQSPTNYIGKTYNSKGVSAYIGLLSKSGEPKESFLPTAQTQKLDFVNAGAVLSFSANMSLYTISLYDSGYTYKAYPFALPKGLKWGMSKQDIEKKIGALEASEENAFKRFFSTEEYILELYFSDDQLNLIKVNASYENLTRNAPIALSSWGIRLLPDGKKISGNTIDGTGTMMWGDKAVVYRGDWAYGLPHGKGEYVDSMGNKYSGEFKLGFFWGEGQYYSKTQGYSYNGNFIMGKRHGEGQVIYANKTAYKGKWAIDNMEGFGTYIVNEKYYYEGEMRNNNFNGAGTLFTPDGYIKGTFKDGKPHGPCEQVAEASQQTLKGTWVNGKKQGDFTLKSPLSTIKKYYEADIEIRTEKK